MLAEKIKEYRLKAGLTQGELAEAVGYDRSTVTKWENGSKEPLATTVKAIAIALNINVAQLYE